MLKLVLDCLGKAETATGLAWTLATTALSLGVDGVKDRPYAFQDCVISINSGTRKIRQGKLTIDNKCEAIYSSGSVATEEIIPQGSRIVTLSSTHPSSSTEWDALYATTGSTATDGGTATITITYTDGTHTATTTITLRKLRAPRKCPVFESKGEIMYVPVWQARHDGTNPEISITNVYV